jgi:hypothetical protein
MSKVMTSENAMRGRSTPSCTRRGGSGRGGPMACPPSRSSAFSCIATNAPRRCQPASPCECSRSWGAITTYRKGDLVLCSRMSAIAEVLAAEGVPTRRAPSGPTEAMTLPELVANTNRLGDSSVRAALSSARANLLVETSRRKIKQIFSGPPPVRVDNSSCSANSNRLGCSTGRCHRCLKACASASAGRPHRPWISSKDRSRLRWACSS